MTQLKSSQSEHASVGRATIGRLFVLEASGNRVLSLNPDGSDRKVIVTECRLPDGIAVDAEAGVDHSLTLSKGIPRDSGARLGEKLRAIDSERGVADKRIGLNDAVLEAVIRSASGHFVPAVGRFEAKPDPKFQIRPEFDAILDESRCFE